MVISYIHSICWCMKLAFYERQWYHGWESSRVVVEVLELVAEVEVVVDLVSL
jgi:hypothetical protein